MISLYTSLVQICTNCLKIKWSQNVLFAASQGWCRKCETANAVSREYVTVQRLKCAVVCYIQGKIFNPTNLVNYTALSIELMMQMWASNVKNYCYSNSLEHLPLTLRDPTAGYPAHQLCTCAPTAEYPAILIDGRQAVPYLHIFILGMIPWPTTCLLVGVSVNNNMVLR